MTIIEQLEKRKKLLAYLNSPSNEEIFTPVKLVEEMLDKLPKEIWTDPNLLWCDPCAKSGVFMLEVVLRLMKNIAIENETERYKHIINNMVKAYVNVERNKWLVSKMVYGSKDSVNRVGIIKDINKINIEDMPKFDVVVGNPPYQHPTNKRWKLWITFIESGLNILKPEGILSLITPISWLNKSGAELNKARKFLTEKTVTYVDVNVNRYFTVGESIGYFICINKSNQTNLLTKIVNDSEFIEDKLLTDKPNIILVTEEDKIKHSILSTMDNSNLPKLNTFSWGYLSNIKDIGHGLSLNKTTTHKYKVYHTASQTYYSSDENLKKYLYPKVIINMSGNYYKEDEPDKYMKVTNNEIAGRGAIEIKASSLREAENIKSFLSSKLYRFYIKQNKSGGFSFGPAGQLPMLDRSKHWTDKDVYDYFKLSTDQINFINENI